MNSSLESTISSENLFYDLNDKGEQQTKNDHCRNGKIKLEIFSFDPDVTGESPDPVKPDVKKINNHPDDDNKYSDCNDPLAGFTVHEAKLYCNTYQN